MNKNIKLGRGLESLLGSNMDVPENYKLIIISINDIVPGKYQPRSDIDSKSLEMLSFSIKSQGLIHPIIVREKGLHYEIIAGERRYRASKLAGLKEVPVIIKSLSDESTLSVGLIENLQRENLNPIDEAKALKRLIDDFNLTHEKIAKIIGKSRSAISNSVRLLNLPNQIQEMLKNNTLSTGHAKAILAFKSDMQLYLAKLAIKNKLNVRQLEKIGKNTVNKKELKKEVDNRQFMNLQKQLSTFIGFKTLIKAHKNENKLIFYFKNNEELNKILKILGYRT